MAGLRHLSCTGLFTCCIVLSYFALTTVRGIRRFNAYNKYYVEDNCKKNENVFYGIDKNGKYSAIKIGASRVPLLTEEKNCNVTIQSPADRGIILHVDSMLFGSGSYFYDCTEYIQIFGDAGNSTKLCGFLQPNDDQMSFVSKGDMKFKYFTNGLDDRMPISGFTLIATAYTNGFPECPEDMFRCNSGQCIWDGFVCDEVVNCPDGSDEWVSHLASCTDVLDFTLAPIKPINIKVPTYRFTVAPVGAAVACSFIVLTIALIRFFCYYHCVRIRRREVLRDFVRARQADDQQYRPAPPPPYTTLINEPTNGTGSATNVTASAITDSSCENPPPYSSTLTSGSDVEERHPVRGIAGRSNEGIKINVGRPPPPYEP